MVTVTMAELHGDFGRLRELAATQPVSVVDDGGEPLVVMSVAAFERLQATAGQRAYHVWELPDELKDVLMASEPPEWTAQYDHELKS